MSAGQGTHGRSSSALSVLFLCDSDSQVFGSVGLARAFKQAGDRVVYGVFGKPLPDSARRLLREFETMSLAVSDLTRKELIEGYDAIGMFSYGSRIAAFRDWFGEAFGTAGHPRPVIFTGFNGFVLDRFEEGAAWRTGYDIIVVAGPGDAKRYSDAFGGTLVARQPLVECGLGHANATDGSRSSAVRRKKLIFAEQTAIPELRQDRLWIASRLTELARLNPGWDVVVKLRVNHGERTFHPNKNRLSRLIQRNGPIPPNLRLSHAPLTDEFATTDLVVTVSSTAVFEAIRSGVPVAVISDFGLSAGFGTLSFLGSGLLASMDELQSLDDFRPRSPNSEWLRTTGLEGSSPKALVDAVKTVKLSRSALPPTFYGPASETPLPVAAQSRIAASRALDALRKGDRILARHLVADARRRDSVDPECLALDFVVRRNLPGIAHGPFLAMIHVVRAAQSALDRMPKFFPNSN